MVRGIDAGCSPAGQRKSSRDESYDGGGETIFEFSGKKLIFAAIVEQAIHMKNRRQLLEEDRKRKAQRYATNVAAGLKMRHVWLPAACIAQFNRLLGRLRIQCSDKRGGGGDTAAQVLELERLLTVACAAIDSELRTKRTRPVPEQAVVARIHQMDLFGPASPTASQDAENGVAAVAGTEGGSQR